MDNEITTTGVEENDNNTEETTFQEVDSITQDTEDPISNSALLETANTAKQQQNLHSNNMPAERRMSAIAGFLTELCSAPHYQVVYFWQDIKQHLQGELGQKHFHWLITPQARIELFIQLFYALTPTPDERHFALIEATMPILLNSPNKNCQRVLRAMQSTLAKAYFDCFERYQQCDPDRAAMWFHQSYILGYDQAYERWNSTVRTLQPPEPLSDELKAQVENCSADEAFLMGLQAFLGIACETNLVLASTCFDHAGQQNHALAQSYLGWMCNNIYQNPQLAVTWYRCAASQGLPPALYNLAFLLHKGRGVNQDYHQARRLFTLAAERGIVAAQSCLGSMYQNGEGGELLIGLKILREHNLSDVGHVNWSTF